MRGKGTEMAWLRLTLQDESMVLVNSTQITDITALSNNRGTEMQMTSWAKRVRETVDDIAAMIEKAEWRERVLRCACAMMSNKHTNGLTEEQVWARAARFAVMEPERPTSDQ